QAKTIRINSRAALAAAIETITADWERCKYLELFFTENEQQRTLTQNAALHKWLELVAETLNDAGLDMRRTLRHDVDIPWTKSSVKEYIWKPVQEALTNKQSTTEANRVEYADVEQVIARHLATKGVQTPPWPKKPIKAKAA